MVELKSFKAGKGMDFITIYYHFMFMYSYEQYDDCIKFYKTNKWWFDKMKDGPRNQVVILLKRIKEK
ncbi:MAG: hypothetical protein ACRC6U_10180 [Fusobacteriaceae bacterium]